MPDRKMTLNLVCGNIGVSADQREAINLAHGHGFESVEARGDFLAGLSPEQLQELKAEMEAKRVVFGAAGLPVDFRKDEASFREGLKRLPRIAAGLQGAGVTRLGTWISPAHDELEYRQNLERHASRLRDIATILKDHGLRFGLEYVGTPSLRKSRRYPFIHSMAGTRDLIGEIGTGNVGLVLDSWHWWTAEEGAEDILKLKANEVVAADLNDAPAGVTRETARDNQRELPLATVVIDVGAFLNALHQIGFDGPVRAEPFNAELNALDNEAACGLTAEAMKKAFALIR